MTVTNCFPLKTILKRYSFNSHDQTSMVLQTEDHTFANQFNTCYKQDVGKHLNTREEVDNAKAVVPATIALRNKTLVQ